MKKLNVFPYSCIVPFPRRAGTLSYMNLRWRESDKYFRSYMPVWNVVLKKLEREREKEWERNKQYEPRLLMQCINLIRSHIIHVQVLWHIMHMICYALGQKFHLQNLSLRYASVLQNLSFRFFLSLPAYCITFICNVN